MTVDDVEKGMEHFPHERELYIHEWKARTGAHVDPDVYVANRWRETDAKAPSPDLESVRSILKKRRVERGQTDSP